MILDEIVKVKINKKNIQHYIKNLPNINLKDEIEIHPSFLIKGSNLKIHVKCDLCDEKRYISYQMYYKNVNSCPNYQIYTCDRCSHVKIKEFNKLKYGCEYYSQTEEYGKKFRKTMMERHGVEYSMQSIELRNKAKETYFKNFGIENPFMDTEMIKSKFKEKWGVEHPSQVEQFRKKIENTNLEKFGYKYPLSSPEIREKINNTVKIKYGGHPMQNDDIRFLSSYICRDKDYLSYLGENISLFRCDCGKDHEFKITSELYYNRIKGNLPICTICYPLNENVSIKEKQILDYIKSIYDGDVISNYRDGLEIDIYLPYLKIGFEFNGLYWHSEEWKERNYHLDKLNHFNDRGIRIVYIWEDDWDNKREIVLSMIKNMILLNNKKIYARMCQIQDIKDIKIIKNFLNKNHLQGYVNSKIKIGLVFEGEIISIMCFDQFEGRKKMNKDEWNLTRFCSQINTTVIGGASKLLKYFIDTYLPQRIVSYSDRDWSIGELYSKLGFSFDSIVKPDYKYIINRKRIHKSKFRKSNLDTNLSESKYMKLNNVKRVWDCGKQKWEIKI